jgi:hypothetical protein
MGHNMGLGPQTWRNYTPLVLLFGVMIAVTLAEGAAHDAFVFEDYVRSFMAVFFTAFATFKLMDLKGFADGYATYDLLAMRARWYAYLYPFIELGFGLLMIADVQSDILLWIELAVMGFGGLGVAIKLAKHEQVQCVCLGTFLKVPLTFVTLIEDFGMAFVALALLVMK